MRVEKRIELDADAQTVWNALTVPDLTRRYFFGCEAVSDWKVGSPLLYRMEHEGQEVVPVHGVVRAVEEPRYLEATCIAAGCEGQPNAETVVTYTLTPKGGGTELAVTQGEFADDGRRAEHESSWDHVLSGLKSLLESSRTD
jgi:uncharacterized protein YndB with AHSA1/START domain